jgi:hypothetical protein
MDDYRCWNKHGE